MKRSLLLLAAGCFLAASAHAQQPTDLLISEYVEGSSFNKAVELYNGTSSPVVLDSVYSIAIYFNGNTTPGTTIDLFGTVAPGDVFVLAEDSADPAILAEADQLTGASLFNGDDAVVLFRNDTVVDAIGQVGVDPGDEWGTGDTSTRDNTLIRQMDDCTADTDTSDAFDPATHYVGFPQDTFANLGQANLDCGDGGADVAADITATGSTTIPATGGPLSYAVTLSNSGSSSATVMAEVNAVLPNGSAFGPIQGPRTVTLRPGQTLGPVSFTSQVPSGAPAGQYTVVFTLEDGGSVVASDSFTFTKAASRAALVAGGELGVYPNPFATEATFRFAVEEAAEVRLAVYDVLGREVAVLAEGPVEAGQHEAVLAAEGLASGVYVWRLAVGSEVETGRLTLAR